MTIPESAREALAKLIEADPEGWAVLEAIREALGAEFAANERKPRLYRRGEGLVDELPSYVGIPYEPMKPPK
jgi:hypothetical protein